MAKRHYLEEVADAIAEAVESRIETIVEALQVDDRPAYQKKLTNYERWLRWKDPLAHRRVAEKIKAVEGEEGVRKWEAEMQSLDEEYGYAGRE